MTGIIILWYGAIVDIPAGWALCDGNGGRPNLQNYIPVGAGDLHAVGDSGGNLTHQHNFTSDFHVHTIPAGSDIISGPTNINELAIMAAAGVSDIVSHAPPYKSLAYIQKI